MIDNVACVCDCGCCSCICRFAVDVARDRLDGKCICCCSSRLPVSWSTAVLSLSRGSTVYVRPTTDCGARNNPLSCCDLHTRLGFPSGNGSGSVELQRNGREWSGVDVVVRWNVEQLDIRGWISWPPQSASPFTVHSDLPCLRLRDRDSPDGFTVSVRLRWQHAGDDLSTTWQITLSHSSTAYLTRDERHAIPVCRARRARHLVISGIRFTPALSTSAM